MANPLIILQKYPLIMIQKQKNLVQITISSQTLRCAFRYATTGPQKKICGPLIIQCCAATAKDHIITTTKKFCNNRRNNGKLKGKIN